MLGVLAAIALGGIIGLTRGGSFKRLEHARLDRMWVVFAAVLLQLAGTATQRLAGGWLSFALAILAYAGIAWFAFENRRVIGMPLLATGALSNFVVIAANGGMPVSLDALRRAGAPDLFRNGLVKGAHIAMRPGVRLRPLADIIPLRYGNVVSAGDLLIYAGLILLLQQLMVGPRGRHLVA